MNRVLVLLAVASVVLGGCGDQGGEGPETLVAKGENFEVTVPELDQLLKRAPQVTREQIVPTRRAILDLLIDQKLLAAAATAQDIDRRPETMQMVEAARRQILATAYAEQISAGIAKPSGSEIQAFYDKNAALFANRKVFTIEEVALSGEPAVLQTYSRTFDQGGLSALVTQLSSEGKEANPITRELLPEELPPATQAILGKLAVGDGVSYEANGSLHLGTIQAIKTQPVSLNQARDLIANRLTIERRQAIVKAEAARLRAASKVQVVDKMIAGAKADAR